MNAIPRLRVGLVQAWVADGDDLRPLIQRDDPAVALEAIREELWAARAVVRYGLPDPEVFE